MPGKIFLSAVVADDGHEGGNIALSAARFIQDKLAASTTVAHIVDVPRARDMAGPPQDVAEYRRVLEQRAIDWLEGRLTKTFGSETMAVRGEVRLGNPKSLLPAIADDAHADLLVIGPHRKEHALDFGGTQRAAFSRAGCHIWSQPVEFIDIRRVFAPIDLSPRSMRALRTAKEVAELIGAPMTVFHASAPPAFADVGMMYGDVPSPAYVVEAMHDATRARFDDEIDAFDFGAVPKVEREFTIGDPVVAIQERALPSDLIVMGTRGHTGVGAALFGGTAYAVLKAGAAPILAIDV